MAKSEKTPEETKPIKIDDNTVLLPDEGIVHVKLSKEAVKKLVDQINRGGIVNSHFAFWFN